MISIAFIVEEVNHDDPHGIGIDDRYYDTSFLLQKSNIEIKVEIRDLRSLFNYFRKKRGKKICSTDDDDDDDDDAQ